jgi:hypothetical protein
MLDAEATQPAVPWAYCKYFKKKMGLAATLSRSYLFNDDSTV